ncbi:MAG: serine peptidase [Rickettsiales bacterium]|nr:MAG: serine peptidase [Rickettsiales bacterium]
MRYLRALFLILITTLHFGAANGGALATAPVTTPAPALSPAHITSFADIVEPLMPTVVNVYTVRYNEQLKNRKAGLPEIFPFEKFNSFFEKYNVPFSFDDLYSRPEAMSLGSGFIIDEEGYIITNDHVVAGADEIYVKLTDNIEIPAKIVGTDAKTDLALLKIETKKKLPFAVFADSNRTRIGDVVIAIGNPLGFGGTVTTGIISSKGRDLGEDLVDDFIQTDAAINAGNSGGPLYNIEGKVIGMNTSIADGGGGTNIGIGFAIPANTVQDIMKQLREKGKIRRGRLNVNIQEVTTELAEALSLKDENGVLIVDVNIGGVGDKAGLQRGDVITKFNDDIVLDSRKLKIFVADTNIGEEIKLTVIRGQNPVILTAKMVEFKKPSAAEIDSNVSTMQESGVTFSNLSPKLITKFGLPPESKGVLVASMQAQEASNELKIGDLVMSIDQESINNIEQFKQIYDKMGKTGKKNVVLLVKRIIRRKESTMFAAFPIK